MKESSNKKKGVLVGVIVALILVVTLGVTFAIYNYSKVGDNQILVTGDIYMKYTGTNQIDAKDMLPIDINNYYSDRYIVNSNMTEEELSSCENYFNGEELYFDEGSDARSFCEGTGIGEGMTFQELLDYEMSNGGSIEEFEQYNLELIENNVIKKEFIPRPVEYKYVRNASMTSEELSSCESYFNELDSSYGFFEEEETARAYCEGTGTAYDYTFQQGLDEDDYFYNSDLEELKSRNIIKEEIEKEYPAIPYFEFTVEGVNKYSKDIWYEIVLKDGDAPADDPKRTEKLRDDLLRFRLVEVVGEEEQEIFTNRGYEDISDETIYVSTINANTKEKITRTYRIYMWISDSVKVGVGEGIDYDMETWNDKVYASVKINVAGDFNEKEVNYTTPVSCFMTQEFQNNGKTEIMITDYDTSCGREVVIPSKINGHEVTVIGNAGGNNEGYIMPVAARPDKSFYSKNLTSIVIPNTVRIIGSNAFSSNYLTKVEIPDSVTWIDAGAFADNPLEEVKVGSGIAYIGVGAFYYHHYLNPKITINKTCDEIKNIEASSKDATKYYPWLNWDEPYTTSGVTIYGSNGEVCDAFE